MSSQISAMSQSVVRSTSVEAAAATADESVDWVYIDGNHAYEFVLEDLRSWYPKVRPGGLVAGDDYDRPGAWWGDGVTRAVNEFVKAEPVVIPANQAAGTLVVEAAGDASEAQLANMVVRAVAQWEGEAAVDQPVTLKVVK